ncbi:hypothetical protein AMELA_G00168560 [Ameiurus melas]|uniref:Uncharacterized protein n=1 Tax=Ameiurus melas TaxID=219545 RepID=A0A7J6AEP4_AMEME|nr:hypothetical protein AMELA_G00168560 [Ameiurus melas]
MSCILNTNKKRTHQKALHITGLNAPLFKKMSGGFTIVTYVHPFLMGQTPPGGNNTGNAFTPSILPFLKGHLKALGTIQIMIGVVTFLFGIVLAVNWNIPISVISGIVYWGSLIYIITGSLSVAAEPKLHPCVVKGSLGMNVVSVVVSGTAIIILCIDCFLQLICEYCSTEENMETVRVIGVLAVLSLLQFFISICISAFACKATCCSEPMVPVVTIAHPAHINPQIKLSACELQLRPHGDTVLSERRRS